jgi:8-oxoguanine deaminase
MRDSAALAAAHGCGLHTHLGETHDEDAFCLAAFGMRPVDYLEAQGWLGPRTWLAHGVHFEDGEIARLGAARVGVCHCPTSNMTLASGFCRTCELEAAGVAVGLGVDGSASNDASNLIEAVRHAVLLNRLTYGADRVGHLDALRWATAGSARCLGRRDIGAIAPGLEADLALYTLDELRFSGGHDPLAALVLCGATRADRVMVAGRWRVEDGMPVGVDVAGLRRAHHAAALALFA